MGSTPFSDSLGFEPKTRPFSMLSVEISGPGTAGDIMHSQPGALQCGRVSRLASLRPPESVSTSSIVEPAADTSPQCYGTAVRGVQEHRTLKSCREREDSADYEALSLGILAHDIHLSSIRVVLAPGDGSNPGLEHAPPRNNLKSATWIKATPTTDGLYTFTCFSFSRSGSPSNFSPTGFVSINRRPGIVKAWAGRLAAACGWPQEVRRFRA